MQPEIPINKPTKDQITNKVYTKQTKTETKKTQLIIFKHKNLLYIFINQNKIYINIRELIKI